MALTKIKTGGIQDDAVTQPKIAAGSVGTTELATDAITEPKIADNAVTRSQIIDGAINGAKVENQSIGAEKLTDGTINNGDIHASADIAGSKLADNSISLAKLEHGTSSNDGKFLRANNGADPTFETVSAGPTVANQGDNRVITATGTADALNAESGVTIDASGILSIQGSGQRQLTIGSTDGSIAALILDGNSNGDGAGGDYAIIRHTSSGDLDLFARDPSGATNYIFRTGSTEKVRFQAGGGISFNGDTAAANSLDDYEEGDWSPGGSWTTIDARYIKVGRTVYAGFSLRANTTGSADVQITNLPFTAANNKGSQGGIAWGLCEHNSTGGWLQGFVDENTTTGIIKKNNANNLTFGSGSNNMNNQAFIRGTFIYLSAT